MTVKEKILYALCLLFFAVLFYSRTHTLNGVLIGVLAVYSFFFFSPARQKWTVFKQRKHIWAALLFIAVLLISIGLSENKGRGFRYLDTRLALFYFPLTIGLLQLTKTFKEKVLLGLAFVTTLVSAICLAYGIYASNFFERPELLYNDSLTNLIARQSIYVSLLVTVSIFIFGHWIFFKPINTKNKMALLGATLFLFIISYFLASRNMMVVLYAVAIGFLFYYILNRKKYLEGLTLFMALGLGVFLILKAFPQTMNRFKELTYTAFNYESMGKESHYNMEVTANQWNGANFRLAAWPFGWNLFKQHPVLGVGLGDKQEILLKEYGKKNFAFAIATRKNIHNNYLDVAYSTGTIGFLFFMLGWIVLPVFYAAKNKDWLSVLIMAAIAVAFITEVYFDRTIGGMIVGFLVPFLLTDVEKT